MKDFVPKQYITNSAGVPVSVVLSMKDFDRLQEDLHDLAVIAERKSEKPVSLAELKKRLAKNGKAKTHP